MTAYLLHDTTCEIRLVHNLYHLFSLTGRARPCSTYKNTQKSRRFKLKSGFWKIFGVRYLSVPKKPVHNLDISAVFEDDPTTIPARKDILGEAINTLNEKVKEIVDARDYLQWQIDNYDSHMIESENKL